MKMHYYLALTSKCNLKCKYCYGKSCEDYLSFDDAKKYDFSLPAEMSYSVEELVRFARYDEEMIITFYGGEPLLRIEKIEEIIDKVLVKEFMLQTNGIFLDKMKKRYLDKISTLLVSIDGGKKLTDFNRGKGTYEKIISNLKKLGFKGEVIARMVVDEDSDVYEEVKYLFENEDYKFKGVHWQLDAQFFKSDYLQREFEEFAKKYNRQIKKLIGWWVWKMKTEKKVYLVYPFVGIMRSLLLNEKSGLRCGAGHSVLGIQTNGVVCACPITAGYKPLYMGDIRSSTLKNIEENKIYVDKQCLKCEVKYVCGGRCLYANKTQLWGEKGFKEVCGTVKFLIAELEKVKVDIEMMIEKGELELKDFEYRKYNGVEIIP